MKNNLLKNLVLAIVGVLCLAGGASATLITGGISFNSGVGGTWVPTGGVDATDIAGATGIHFNNPAQVVAGSGDYSSLVGKDTIMKDFQFDPLVKNNPLWRVVDGDTIYKFTLQDINVDYQSSTVLALSGTGILKITGFSNTLGSYTFTGNGSDDQPDTFSWSSNGVRVPEPGALFAFGMGMMGLLGFAGLRRRED